ncbi:MAG: response regulator, partial [Stellaceae bacterium]
LPRHRGNGALLELSSEPLVLPRARQGETVLVVEDDPDVRTYTLEMVSDLGYQVTSAPDGFAALQVLDAHPELRLLFTDVGLPGGMNGRQLADEAILRRPGIKVLFTTGYARNAIVHHGRLDPGVEVVFKPFTYSDLAAKLRKAFES